jgi:hypothetical protein
MSSFHRTALSTLLLSGVAAPLAAAEPETVTLNRAPSAADWAALAKLPDWSGVWTPGISDQVRRMKADPVPWQPRIGLQIKALEAEKAAGRPKGLFVDCLPEGTPTWMLISHNAMEILFTPGRVTLLGEMDGNRIRRIYTDGRPHPPDPDPTFHGHSIGHWEGQTLVVDTVAVLPQSYLAIDEAIGVPNNGDLHVIERIHLAEPDVLHDDLEVIAPRILTRPWKTTRFFYRQRARKYDIVEGVCIQGFYAERKDAQGNAVFVPVPHADGNPVAQPARSQP